MGIEMCMAATYKRKYHYFGRNLDYEISYGECVVVTPRNFVLEYRNGIVDRTHLAIIGMASVIDGHPLYFDGTNENGLSMAGLNFPGNAYYSPRRGDASDIASFEFIPWILGRCSNVTEARKEIESINLTDECFREDLPPTPLHWIVSDRDSSITVEFMKDGLHIYDNEVGILTNNPPFPYHMFNLANHMGASPKDPENRISDTVMMDRYSRGMGSMGIPGDLSSASRFVKAAFTKLNSVSDDTDEGCMTQFFHIMDSVQQQRGCCDVGDGKYEITLYTSCCNTDTGVYYYRTYGNSQICGVDMHHTDLDGGELYKFPIVEGQHVMMLN